MRRRGRDGQRSSAMPLVGGVIAGLILAASGRAELVFDQIQVDLGKVRSAGVIEHAFAFRVVGNRPAEIVQVRPSCGCVRPKLDESHFAPGEKGQIVLGVHALGQAPGRHDYRLSLTVRDPTERTIVLTLSLDLSSDIIVQPAQVLVYSNGQKPLTQTVTITDTRVRESADQERGRGRGAAPRSLEVKGLVASSQRLEARLRPPAQTEGAAEPGVRRVELVIGADFPIGKTEERIAVTTNDPEYPAFEIPVLVIRSARVRCAPDSLTLDTASAAAGAGARVSRLIILTDRDGAPIEVESVTCDLANIECQWPREAAKTPRIAVTFDPSRARPAIGEGSRSGHLRIRIRRPEPLELSVPVTVD